MKRQQICGEIACLRLFSSKKSRFFFVDKKQFFEAKNTDLTGVNNSHSVVLHVLEKDINSGVVVKELQIGQISRFSADATLPTLSFQAVIFEQFYVDKIVENVV